MTRTELNTLIDTTITNKTAPNSITPQNEGDALKAVADYVDQEIEAIELLPGPVGPAGLNWQGQWTSGASYVEDDAVGYNGASWFCINATSGTTTPNLDVSSWALLASQGATGPQGIQGASGIATLPYKPYLAEIALDSSPITIPLQNDLESVITITRSSTAIVITASDPVFTMNKTHIMCSSYNLGGITYTMHPIRFSDTQIYLRSFKGDGTSAIGYGTSIFVEIKVFN